MNYTLKQLKYFVLAGEHRSVTKAAEAIYVSQPSISSAIHHLEDVTGLQLFIRHHAQGLTLTPQGWQFSTRPKICCRKRRNWPSLPGCSVQT